MTSVGNGFPTTEEEYWLDVIDSVTLSGLPVRYMNSISVYFDIGQYCYVDISHFLKHNKNISYIEDGLDRIFVNWAGHITDVNINMNIKKVIKDVKKAVKKLEIS